MTEIENKTTRGKIKKKRKLKLTAIPSLYLSGNVFKVTYSDYIHMIKAKLVLPNPLKSVIKPHSMQRSIKLVSENWLSSQVVSTMYI